MDREICLRNICGIVEMGLCSACGSCTVVCPVDAIEMRYNNAGFLYAELDKNKCVNCRKCIQICPSNQENCIIQKPLKDHILGKIQEGYLGYASNSQIRGNGQSGGVVTALLNFLLERGEIDGAVVADFHKKERKAISIIASNREELLNAQGSYYCQTSACKTYLENCGRKLAIVLLGCQARALSNQEKYQGETVNKPVIKIGLFCGGQFSRHIIDEALNMAGIGEKDAVSKFRFRAKDKKAGGIAGDMLIETEKKQYTIPREERIRLFDIWKCYRCNVCLDFYNTECDIVCGDPWGINDRDVAVKNGANVILARTTKGQRLLEDALKEGIIQAEVIPFEKIYKGQNMLDRLIYIGNINKEYVLPFKHIGIKKNGIEEKKNRNILYDLKYSYRLYFSEHQNLKNLINNKKKIYERKKQLTKFKKTIKTILKKFFGEKEGRNAFR